MLSGDTAPWRDIGHARWYDPHAELESPRGGAFKAARAAERALFRRRLRGAAGLRPLAREFEQLMNRSLPADPAYAQERIDWGTRTVRIQHTFGHRLHVWIFEEDALRRTLHNLTAFGVDPTSDCYFTIDDVGSGAQAFRLTVAAAAAGSVLWRKTNVGPAAAFLGDRVLYQTVENALRYPCVRSVKKTTGRDDRLVYENTDPRFQVELHAPPRQPDVFVKIANALDQRLGRITAAGEDTVAAVTWFTPANPSHANGSGETLIPIRAGAYATNGALVVDGRRVPLLGYATGAIVGDAGTILVTTVQDGCTSLYSYDEATLTASPLFISSAPNDVILHLAASTPTVSITSYYAPTEVFEVKEGALVPVFSFPHPLRIAHHSHGFATAEDDTRIPYTIVSMQTKPRGLLVEAYGAYGISSHRSYPIRWLPWLRRGYAVCVAQVRGGRENGDAWYDAARTALRKRTTFADAAAVIRAAQRRTGVPPVRTIIYGRSAGGWTAAYVGEHYSDSVGAVYAEVPYLDVLRTTTNPALPLTKLEYDEFGDPRSRPEEFTALQTLSPIDSAPAVPARAAPFLYVKTAAHDVQVLPYEAFKWAARMRELGWDVVVNMDDDGGHFVSEKIMYVQFAQDLLLLERSRHRPHQTRKHRSHAARGTTLRRKSSRKH